MIDQGRSCDECYSRQVALDKRPGQYFFLLSVHEIMGRHEAPKVGRRALLRCAADSRRGD